VKVEGTAWVDECSILQTILLKLLLVLIGDAECLDCFIIPELQVGFSCAILHQTEHLDAEHRVLYEAPIAADRFIAYFPLTDLTLILNLNELHLHYEPTYLCIH
jgi:hypothetical protein